MIYILQVRKPWISNIYWQDVAAFSSPEEAKQTQVWRDAAHDEVRLIEIPASGSLSDLIVDSEPFLGSTAYETSIEGICLGLDIPINILGGLR